MHLLFRSPLPGELSTLRAAARGITLRCTPSPRSATLPPATSARAAPAPREDAAGAGRGPGGNSTPSAGSQANSKDAEWGAFGGGEPAAEAFAPAALLSGEPADFRELADALGRAAPAGAALAGEIGRALRPPRPAIWQLRTRALRLDRPLVMGIVNVTPDSFSDGGRFADPEAAVRRGARLVESGADMLDVGGESTRPGAARVPCAEEESRVIPVVERLAALGAAVSVDTTRARVAWRALEAGAEVVNDVSALRFDPGMGGVVAHAGAGIVLMHMRGTPATMQLDPRYQDVMGEILAFLEAALANARSAGIEPERCAVDPGIGFGKRRPDNDEILYRLEELSALGRPLLVGPSRKGFLDPARRLPAGERLPETIAAACLAALWGAHILRVHDAGECRRALDLVRRIRASPAEE